MQKIQDLRSLPKRLERLEQFERLEPRLRNHGVTMHIERISQVHPGRVLLEEFLAPRGISVWHLAKDIGVSPRRIFEFVQGQRAVNGDIARRLAHYFGMSERYWLELQARHDGTRKDKLPKEFLRKQSLRYVG